MRAARQRGRCAPLPARRGVARALAGRAQTVVYHLYARLTGLSEGRPALWVSAAAALLAALRAPAPRVASSVTVSRPRAAVLRALLDAEGLRRFMQGVERLEPGTGACEGKATIQARGAGRARGGESGRTGIVSVEPAPGERGTEIKVVLPGARPRGLVARAAAKVLAEAPRRRLRGDLRRLRQWIEVGEIPTTAGQPSGRRGQERS
ncbi:hypothetical protein [Sorangium sp. So ce131]|uniref:hypothetical protein n=1 Tax=Sorangium sp. So ce131 TaxID=3133282 RepID=UPI003F62A740